MSGDQVLTQVAFWQLFWSVFVGMLAHKGKGRFWDGAIYGILLGPLGIPLMAYMTKDSRPLCPRCREPVDKRARECTNCGHDPAAGLARLSLFYPS
jgi:hypothetical protein